MLTFVEFIEDSVKKHWDYSALTNYNEGTLTYGETALTIKRIHRFYEKIGIKKGDKVAQIGRNNANWGITFLSTISYGTVSVPLLQDFPSGDIENTVNHSDSVLMFISDYIFEKLDIEKFPNIRAFISLENFDILYTKEAQIKEDLNTCLNLSMSLTPENFNLEQIPHDALASISYTSGTSGLSKGVMLSHGNFATNIEFGFDVIDFKPGDQVVSFLPLAHAYGLAFEFLVEFMQGCHITFLGKIPSPQIILQAFKDIKPRLVILVPLIIEKVYRNKVKPAISKGLPKILLGAPLLKKVVHKKVKKQLEEAFGGNFIEVIIGGAALNKEVESFLREIGFRYTVGYGMTECAPIISYAPWHSAQKFSCGYPIRQCTVKIDSPDPESVEGEILVKGTQVMMGYYKNPTATKESFDDEGWLKTGDLGVMNKKGYITIKGRSKNMILGASGQNIYPEEIEARINSLPYVMESLVIEKEGRLHALIVPDLEKAEQDGLNRETVKAHIEKNQKELNQQMPNYMAISRIEMHDEEFIKTPKKSIKRYLYTNN
ncbi:MAG TPA: long-chain fatty acid--CoA ligase [Marinilabiliales bacterium]|nr:MAG: long-chain fatty acid--CoA ligase [Bacteroidetes bacterium GWA2_40_14]OFX58247.1 MAG: long-chain fatty acid--CoA ligase [Bacteroidetes bacterium GWC2_40_13]OFX72012.1 MAG: long-chain fatty acid--CoA ligase [Bacteroidetes bacterium GWD2_40_43]OFX89681.1 MAG: long-chain fatty acid--CoA ligase [Bacteroidetes bacterium GWE2_40_63]OFY24197.1 MAG: long-chain fatty acid--CoA ligase [Bacteroidetes bacterium GWF2_40_13]OFZ26390.1 MAG: long-chain fatty acid--CoA ligase [Bacteroidetes bacterium R